MKYKNISFDKIVRKSKRAHYFKRYRNERLALRNVERLIEHCSKGPKRDKVLKPIITYTIRSLIPRLYFLLRSKDRDRILSAYTRLRNIFKISFGFTYPRYHKLKWFTADMLNRSSRFSHNNPKALSEPSVL
jgi:hypothetical protein